MKILLLSLLRLGDILMHREILRSLKSCYPRAEVHFLINAQFSSVRDLLPEVDSWKMFPREIIQQILVERRQPAKAAFQIFDSLVSELNAQKYDLVLNLTHNFFSAHLMDLIEAEQKRGATFLDGKKRADGNPWQTYLNEKFSLNGQSQFHYIEVLLRALDLPVVGPRPALDINEKGPIYLQTLTADPKKNWGLHRFRELFDRLRSANPHRQIQALCSPSERELVLTVFGSDQVISPSLNEAAELMRQARLLVTGDTSLQHLAAEERCQVVSLFLGSADFVKTAPWQSGAWVIRSKVSCAPCRHSEPCFQPSHLCAEDMEVDKVFNLVQSLLQNEPVVALEKSIFQTRFEQGHFTVNGPTNLKEMRGFYGRGKSTEECPPETREDHRRGFENSGL